jgi:hypothetical protein
MMASSRTGSVLIRSAAVLAVLVSLAAVLAASPAGGAAKALTKAKALKLFYTRLEADVKFLSKSEASEQFINTGERASDSANLTCDGCVQTGELAPGAVTSDKLAPPEAWRHVGQPGQPSFTFLCPNAQCWFNYGQGFDTVAFFKDPFGVVHLKGLALCDPADNLGCTTNDGSSTIFTLPGGYRPSARKVFGVIRNDAHARLDVTTAGEVHVTTNNSDGTWVSLEGISFRA